MATYEICGTCSILIRDGKTSICLFPTVGYVSADNELAVFYSQAPPPCEAKLEKLSRNSGNKFTEVQLYKKDSNLFSILNSAAGNNKKIKLFLDDSLKITGCLFPAP